MKRTSLLSLLVCLVTALANGQTVRIVHPIEDWNTVMLGGNVHPMVVSSASSSSADEATPMEHMILSLKADVAQESQLESLIAQQNNPKSSEYHQYLSPKDFASKFGAHQADIAKITDWLQQHGFTIDEIPTGKRSIVFSGTAGQVANTFKTEIRKYNVAGVTHYANASSPQLPLALSEAVDGLVKLHDFRHGHSAIAPKAPDFTSSGGSHYLAPADYGTIYDINPLYSAGINGSGQSIAIIARSDIAMSDVTSFRSSFGLKANNPVFINTNSDPGVLEGDNVETTLDTEWSGAVAPNATVKVIISSSTNTSDGIDLSALYAVNNNVAPIISLSYGSCEAFMGSGELAFYNNLWKQAAAQGQTVLVSSGDSGAAGCDGGSESRAAYGLAVNGLCSSPYSTCVGGTEFADTNNPGQYWLPGNNPTYGSATGYIPEKVWNESGDVSGGSDLWSGSGGVSMTYSKPPWQAGPGVPADGMRDVPDVSMAAAGHDGYLIVLSGQLNSVGGTSAAAPSFAGLMALVDQKANARQGLANSSLYAMATKQASGGAAVFHDITTGNNSVPGVTGYSATSGYDRASGLGSVDANVMVNNWSGAATSTPSITLSASPASLTVQEGKSASTTVTSVAMSLNAAVNLTVSGAPTGLTAVLASSTIASPGSGSVVLNVSASNLVIPGSYSLAVKAISGSQTASLNISVTIPVPTFILTPTSSTLTALSGNSAQTGMTVTPQNGFNSPVTLSSIGLPNGVTASFSPANLPAVGGSSNMTITAAKTVSAGGYLFTVSATGGGVTKTTSLTLTISAPSSCSLAANPGSLSLAAGRSATASLACAITQGAFAAPLALTVSGAPSGMTASAPASLTAGSTATLNLATALNTAAGKYNLSITASGSGFTQTITLPVTVTAVNTFTLASSSNALTIQPGSNGQLSVTAQALGTFNSAVNLSVTGMPSGVTAGLSKTSLAAPGSGSATITLTANTSVKAGTYPLVITANGGGASQTLPVSLTIAGGPSFTLSLNATSVTIRQGDSGTITSSTGNYIGGFNGQLSLVYSGLAPGMNYGVTEANANNNTVNITMSLTVPASVAPGTYPVTVTCVGNSGSAATGNGVTRTATFNLIVTKK